MQYVCRILFLRINCDFLKAIVLGALLLVMISPVQAQIPDTLSKVLYSGTTLDSIRVSGVVKGSPFLEVKSYFEEFSVTKPGSSTQLYLVKQNAKGNLVVRYVYENVLLDFRMETTLEYANNEIQVLELDQGRRAPLRVILRLQYNKGMLKVDLL